MRRSVVCLASGMTALALSVTSCSGGSKATAGSTTTRGATPAAPVSTAAVSTAGSGGGTTNVCSLLSAAKASSLNKVTYGAATAKHVEAGYDTCTYANTGKEVDPIDIQALTVDVISLAGCYDELEQADGPGTKVPGIGDAAFGYQIGIDVKDGDRCVEVSGLTHAELDGDYGPDRAMAKIILGALH